MAAVMRHAADIDDQAYCKDFEELSRLRTENGILRELLMISTSPQGANLLLHTPTISSKTSDSSSPNDTEHSDKVPEGSEGQGDTS